MSNRPRSPRRTEIVSGKKPTEAVAHGIPEGAVDPAAALQRTTAPASAFGSAQLIALQRSAGNQAVQGLLTRRLNDDQPTDTGTAVDARDVDTISDEAEEAVTRAASSSGQPLPEDLRDRFEHSLHTDLSEVRVHTGPDSAKAADAVAARAYTVGRDIHFAAGFYAPTTPRGANLLAHETAHTVQQRSGILVGKKQPAGAGNNRPEVSRPEDSAEVEASLAAGAMMRGEPALVSSQHPSAILRDKGDQKAPGASPAVLPQVIPVELNLESKGPKSGGYVKMNKAYLKLQGKITDSNQPAEGGAVNVGPSVGGKSADGKNSGQVGVTAEAKKSAQTFLNKEFDAMVNSLVKSVTGKDDAVKTELFAKAKAEAKAGSKEGSIKVGYDFGVDATLFGVAKATAQVKLTLAGLKYKPSDKPPVSATVLAADFSQKFALKRKKAFEVGGSHYDIEGSVDFGAEFEPNWEKIALDAAKSVGVEAGVMLAIDAALVAGPPLLAGIIIAQGIYMAGEKGALHASINTGATDAKQAAMDYAQMMTGSEMVPTGPRAKEAVARARSELAQIAANTQVTVEELMAELRKTEGPASFSRIHSMARRQVQSAYASEVRKVISAWRNEHYILAIWTRHEDDVAAAMKGVDIIFSH